MLEKIIKGIKYLLDEENLTAQVIQKKGYEGDLIIPETIVFQKVAYRVTSIGYHAFDGCKSLTSIVIPDSVTRIGGYAFIGCKSLTSIVIPDSVTSIGEGAFKECASLTSIIIPDSVTWIGDGTFSSCSSLTSIVIPDSVTIIGDWAFNDCTSLTSIVIPDGVTSIGDGAFRGCKSLKQDPTQEIKISNFKYRLLMHNHLTMVLGYSGRSATINIPSEINHEGVIYRVTSIAWRAFRGCSSLTSIVIPDSVTSIGKEAFSGCSSLTSMVIPESVTNIEEGAFIGCKSLTSITFQGTIAQWNEIDFGNRWNDEVPINVVHCTDGDVEI